MQLKQLEVFIDAAENLNFTAVAQKNYISQPAVTKQIKALEEELGFELFIRKHKKIELTEAGRLYCQLLKPLMRDFKLITGQARDLATRKSPTIRIGYTGTIFNTFLSDILRIFYQKYPMVQFSYYNNSVSMIEYMQEDDLDLIFGDDNLLSAKGYRDFIPLRPIQYYFIVPFKDVLADKKCLSFQDMDGKTIISPAFYKSLNNRMSHCFNNDCTHSDIHLVNSLDELFIKISLGEGFAILPDYCLKESTHISTVPAVLPFKSTFGISIKNGNVSEQIQYFISVAQKVISEINNLY